MINRTFFFQSVGSSLFNGRLSPGTRTAIAFILDVWEDAHAKDDDRWLAYALGTTHLETGAVMKPIHERGGVAYFTANYDIRGRNPARARRMGNTAPGDGTRYHGRGYVQLTWKANYAIMSDHLTGKVGRPVDLVREPDLALRPDFAAEIMFHGMRAGAFTGRKFGDYFTKNPNGTPAKDNWTGARAIINGTDKAAIVAGFGRRYYAALSYL